MQIFFFQSLKSIPFEKEKARLGGREPRSQRRRGVGKHSILMSKCA